MNYKYEVQLSATPEAVFKALTTSKGIAVGGLNRIVYGKRTPTSFFL